METLINIIVVDKTDDTIISNDCIVDNIDKAEDFFLKKCEKYFLNFKNYSKEHVHTVLDNGYLEDNLKVVYLSWATIIK